jgi:hypothetical protein
MYPVMPYPPSDYHICPCCGTEFGNDDAAQTHTELRAAWIDNGARWFFGSPAPTWNPWRQLEDAGYAYEIPWLRGLTVKQTVQSVYNIDIGRVLDSESVPYMWQTA